MTVFLLPEEPFFPPVSEAESDGLLAIGGDLSPERLIQAYAHGIFPWFEEEGEPYWFSPEPRLVLLPENFRVSGSLSRVLKSGKYRLTCDIAFAKVIGNCAAVPRPGQDGTWISPGFVSAYHRLHEMGIAHSFEAWKDGELAGGLYGVSLGNAFFGESMFSKRPDASKAALYALVQICRLWDFGFIDCQAESDHLVKLGANPMARNLYLSMLEKALEKTTRNYSWAKDFEAIPGINRLKV